MGLALRSIRYNNLCHSCMIDNACQSINQSILKSVWDLAQIHETMSVIPPDCSEFAYA